MFSLSTILSKFNPTLQREEKNPENFASVNVKTEKEKLLSPAKDHSYNLRDNHTHRIAEAVNLAGGGGERGRGRGRRATGAGRRGSEPRGRRRAAAARRRPSPPLRRSKARPPRPRPPQSRPADPSRGRGAARPQVSGAAPGSWPRPRPARARAAAQGRRGRRQGQPRRCRARATWGDAPSACPAAVWGTLPQFEEGDKLHKSGRYAAERWCFVPSAPSGPAPAARDQPPPRAGRRVFIRRPAGHPPWAAPQCRPRFPPLHAPRPQWVT